MNAGHTFRRTETHALLGGVIEAIAFREPGTGTDRYAMTSALEEGTDYYVVDYPDRTRAVAAYEKEVYANRSDDLLYHASDIRKIVVDRDSAVPAGMVMLDDGGLMPEEDYETLYGPPPSPITWIRMPRLENPERVRAMSAARAEQRLHAARSYSLIKPPRTGRRVVKVAGAVGSSTVVVASIFGEHDTQGSGRFCSDGTGTSGAVLP